MNKIVDTHQHVFWHNRDDHRLVVDLDDQDIEYAWLLTWEIQSSEDDPQYHSVLNPLHFRSDGTHAGIPLSDLLLARDHHPGRFVLGYCPHPAIGNASALLRAAVKMHDVQVCGEWKFRMLINDPRCLELFHTAGELNLPVVLHLDVPYLFNNGKPCYQPHWYGGTVDHLEQALQACPETIFIGHGPGFWREISGDSDGNPDAYPSGLVTPGGRLQQLLTAYPNLYADLSAGSARRALARDPQQAVDFLMHYSDRLLFARDYYGNELRALLEGLELSGTILAKIFWQNAEHLVKRKKQDSVWLPPGRHAISERG